MTDSSNYLNTYQQEFQQEFQPVNTYNNLKQWCNASGENMIVTNYNETQETNSFKHNHRELNHYEGIDLLSNLFEPTLCDSTCKDNSCSPNCKRLNCWKRVVATDPQQQVGPEVPTVPKPQVLAVPSVTTGAPLDPALEIELNSALNNPYDNNWEGEVLNRLENVEQLESKQKLQRAFQHADMKNIDNALQ